MNNLQLIESKIIDAEQVKQLRAALQGKTVVFTNGCFDLMHRGHATYLAQARDMGDVLVVGLNSDSSVKRLKGASRPIVEQYSRAFMLAALSAVDYVTFFDEDTPLELIRLVQPDVLVKGGDYTRDNIVGASVVTARGGRVETIPFVEGFSSTNIINKIKVSTI